MFDAIARQLNDIQQRLRNLERVPRSQTSGLVSTFPTPSYDKQRVFHASYNLEFFWNATTNQWLSTEVFPATLAESRVLAPYSSANINTTDTFALIYHLDNRASAIRIVDSYFWVAVGVTNNSTNYYTYRVDISANGGTITNLLNETSTGFGGINTNWVATIPDTTIAQNSNGARSSIILKKVGSPTTLTFRGVLRYRLVG